MAEVGGIFQRDDLVWAKMKGFSPWPGKITDPPIELKKAPKKNVSYQCIFFFGTLNYAWIEESNIKPYFTYKDDLIKSSKTAAFREAVEQIEAYIQDPDKFEEQYQKINQSHNRDIDSEFNKLKDTNDTLDTSSKLDETVVVTPTSKKSISLINTSASVKKSPKRKSEKKVKPILGKEKVDRFESKSLPPSKRKRTSGGSVNNHDGILTDDDYSAPPVRTNISVMKLLNRPLNISRAETAEIDIASVSQTLKSKNISPSTLKFGFLGLGIMGSGIVKNLLNSGHKVYIWNRTVDKYRKFVDAGAQSCRTPLDVVDNADITFSCVSDPQAAKDVVFGNCGVLHSETLADGKGYVEMTNIDAETSNDIYEGIVAKGGRYLEAQIQGSKPQAEEGTLVILAAGERSLFDQCQTCFEAMGKNSFFLGEVGNASKMNLVLQLIAGVSLGALGEALALADRAGLQLKDVMEILELTGMASEMFLMKGQAMVKSEFPTELPLAHIQKDLRLALNMAENLEQPLPLTAATNEIYRHAKRLGYGEHDASAVYVRARF